MNTRRTVTSIMSKLEQDDKILAELESMDKMRCSSSRRKFTDDDRFKDPDEKSSSLPSLNNIKSSNMDESYDSSNYHKKGIHNSIIIIILTIN